MFFMSTFLQQILRPIIKSVNNNFVVWINVRSVHLIPSYKQIQSAAAEPKLDSEWESVVGLEIHAQINAVSKLFSAARAVNNAPTNTEVSYFDAALPGTLPVLNRYCVEAGVLTALALNCTVHKISMFDRKHYFYPDLPAGYQITQQFQPLATNGHLDFMVYDTALCIKPYKCTARLKQLQLEQDSGRSFHIESKRKTLIDLNRAGIGLMELVFEPDLKNGLEASVLVKELQLILSKLGTCSCLMEEGALRVDANISVHRSGEPFGVRTEVKNLNSLKYIAKAIDYEIKRQIEALESGGVISNETRSYDFKSKKTVFMRDKEGFQDYRFMPEPNLPPIVLCDNSDKLDEDFSHVNIDELRQKITSLPSQERQRLMTTYNISYESADKIVKQEGLIEFFEAVTSLEYDQEYVILFLTNNVQHQFNCRKLSFQNCIVSRSNLKELIGLVQNKIISDSTVNDILEMFFNGDQRSAKEIVEKYNWFLISSEEELEVLCLKVMKENSKLVKKYRKKLIKKFMTELLIKLNEKANNRAAIKIAESVFNRLIEPKPKKDVTSKE